MFRVGEYGGLRLLVPEMSTQGDFDQFWMLRALELARRAAEMGEVPVGAVVVAGRQILGEGCNAPISKRDPTAHAEIEAIRSAAQQADNYRLIDATLYCTLEPCVMCAGALVNARLRRLVFAIRDLRFGGVRSKFSLADSELLNHRLEVVEGILAAEASELLAAFFRTARTRPQE